MSRMVPEDLYSHTKIISLDAHSGSDALVFTTSRPDKEGDVYGSTLWLTRHGAKADDALRLTHDGPVSHPRLSPDGFQCAFLGKRGSDKRPTPYLLPLGGGEAQRISGLDDLQVEAIQEWSADGKKLLVLVVVPHAEDARDDVDHPARPHVIRFAPYKLDGNGYTVGHRTHLFEVDPAGSKAPKPLTGGERNVVTGTWSPDGRRLAYVANGEGEQRHRTSLWLREDGGDPRMLLDTFPTVSELAWSPNGQELAFSAGEIEGYSASHAYVWFSGNVRGPLLPHPLEGSLIWAPDGGSLATIVAHRGLFRVATLATDGGKLMLHDLGDSQVSLLKACKGGLALVCASYTELDEVIALAWDAEVDARPLTGFNKELSKRIQVSCDRRQFTVPDGDGGTETVEAWLLQGRHRPGGAGPVVVDMHGGPHSVALMDFASHTYLYSLLSNGWTVVAPNTVGSSSYGEEFALRLQGRWGELDFPQIQAIVAQLTRDGIAGECVACTGKSYGGFLSAWAIANGPEFRGAVVSAPVADVASHAGTSDSGYYVTPFAMGGSIDDFRDRYDALSPVEYVSHAHGPVLFLNGDQDLRCPVGQAEQLFTRLLRLGCAPASMVIYPGGSHALAATGRPTHREDYHARVVEFLQGIRDNPRDARPRK